MLVAVGEKKKQNKKKPSIEQKTGQQFQFSIAFNITENSLQKVDSTDRFSVATPKFWIEKGK